MSAFKVLVQYENPSYNEIVEVEAKKSGELADACGGILYSDRDMISRLESLNIYCSRRVVSCTPVERDWREVFLGAMASEEHV